jgi:hypothetical protein
MSHATSSITRAVGPVAQADTLGAEAGKRSHQANPSAPSITYRLVVRDSYGNAFAIREGLPFPEALLTAMQWAVEGIRTEVLHG